MTKQPPHTSLCYVKQFLLATFYGFRQWGSQILAWEIVEYFINLTGLYYYLYGGHSWMVRQGVYWCLFGFTMLYHWTAVLIPKEKAFWRFLIPYILCAAQVYYWGTGKYILLGWALPMFSLLLFVLESYLKAVLTPHPKTFKIIKVVCNTLCGIVLALAIVLFFISCFG
jgi:hypothetical protein